MPLTQLMGDEANRPLPSRYSCEKHTISDLTKARISHHRCWFGLAWRTLLQGARQFEPVLSLQDYAIPPLPDCELMRMIAS